MQPDSNQPLRLRKPTINPLILAPTVGTLYVVRDVELRSYIAALHPILIFRCEPLTLTYSFYRLLKEQGAGSGFPAPIKYESLSFDAQDGIEPPTSRL